MYKVKIENKIPIWVEKPTYSIVQGVRKKSYDEAFMVYGAFKSYGGTERDINGIFSIEDTAIITTYFRPDITGECRVRLANNTTYEIISEPENIEMRNQYVQFKVRRINGKS